MTKYLPFLKFTIAYAHAAAIFFSVYETMKGALEPAADAGYAPLVHMAAASVGETVRGRMCVLCRGVMTSAGCGSRFDE